MIEEMRAAAVDMVGIATTIIGIDETTRNPAIGTIEMTDMTDAVPKDKHHHARNKPMERLIIAHKMY
jgi:hypothetical protein